VFPVFIFTFRHCQGHFTTGKGIAEVSFLSVIFFSQIRQPPPPVFSAGNCFLHAFAGYYGCWPPPLSFHAFSHIIKANITHYAIFAFAAASTPLSPAGLLIQPLLSALAAVIQPTFR